MVHQFDSHDKNKSSISIVKSNARSKQKHTHTQLYTLFSLKFLFPLLFRSRLILTLFVMASSKMKQKIKTKEMLRFFFCAILIQAILCQDLHVPNIICILVGMRLWFHFSWLHSRGMRINFRFEFFVTVFDQKNERENEQQAKEKKRNEKNEKKKLGKIA